MPLMVVTRPWAVTNTYLVVNIVASAVYFLLFCVALSQVMRDSKTRVNPGALFMTCTFPLLVGFFLVNVLFELSLPRKGVETLFYVFTFLPVVIAFIFRKQIFPDLLEKKKSEARFDELKGEFLTVASHELRTPLSIITGFAEILVREKLGPLNEEQKRRVRKILMQGQRLNRIIDNLLDLSRIRTGKIEVRHDVLAIVPILKACLDDHQIVCDQQGLELVDGVKDDLPDVIGDIERVTQILVNLLNNAIKYTHPGGRIALRVCEEPEKPELRIEIEDTGIGLTEESVKWVFEEFYRATDQHTRKYSGSGLGLAIVKQLVEAQGGAVGVSSKGLGHGSLFYFTLLKANGASPSAGPKKTSANFQKK